jgi:pimeloyl-ACP methyl ester carboxylesterase
VAQSPGLAAVPGAPVPLTSGRAARGDEGPPREGLRWEEQDVAVGGRRLHLRRAAGAGKPLLFLHGLGASGVVWQALARRLAPDWAPIAPDLPGHGESDPAPGPEGYAPQSLAGAVVGLLDALGVARVPVVGHSLGALVALAMVAEHPDRVPAAVLLDPPVDPERRNPDVAEVYRLRREPPGALEAYLAEGSGSPLAARALASVFRQADDAVFRTYLDAPGRAASSATARPRGSSPGSPGGSSGGSRGRATPSTPATRTKWPRQCGRSSLRSTSRKGRPGSLKSDVRSPTPDAPEARPRTSDFGPRT